MLSIGGPYATIGILHPTRPAVTVSRSALSLRVLRADRHRLSGRLLLERELMVPIFVTMIL